MELALILFAGLVLFAAFGKPATKWLQAAAPVVPRVLGHIIARIPWVAHICLIGFAILINREQKDWEGSQRILLFVVAFGFSSLIHAVCIAVAGFLLNVDPAIQAATKDAFADALTIVDEGERWSISFDEMKARVEHGKSERTYLLKRSKDGEWFAREKKGDAWCSLEEINERISSLIETRWRKLT